MGVAAVVLLLPAALTTFSTAHTAARPVPGHHRAPVAASANLPGQPITAVPAASPTPAGGPLLLPLLGTTAGSAAAPAPRPGAMISVPSVGLEVGVADYTDCSGHTAMTRASAVHYVCTPGAVTTLVGHNPGVFTPLTRSHTGDKVHYQHDGVDDVFTISEVQRVSPREASAYSQDGSYPHAVLATCAEPDSSAYWIFIALPEGAVQAAPQRAAAQPAQGSGQPGGGASAPPSPDPSPSPSPAGGTIPGGVPLPPPPV
ncbi:MAG: sortase domain-bontaining protein [Candidatus Dormibacteria bacterium]